jgi:hypothetical protein
MENDFNSPQPAPTARKSYSFGSSEDPLAAMARRNADMGGRRRRTRKSRGRKSKARKTRRRQRSRSHRRSRR